MGAAGAGKGQKIVRYISIDLSAGLFYCNKYVLLHGDKVASSTTCYFI